MVVECDVIGRIEDEWEVVGRMEDELEVVGRNEDEAEVVAEDAGERGGVVGGVGGKFMYDMVFVDRALEGGRYVTAIALCRPVMSRLGAINATVTSPGEPDGEMEGIAILKTESSLDCSSYRLSEHMASGSKCFQLRTFFAAAAGPTIVAPVSEGNWSSVSAWQWSGLS